MMYSSLAASAFGVYPENGKIDLRHAAITTILATSNGLLDTELRHI
jgi:hypothetical protein